MSAFGLGGYGSSDDEENDALVAVTAQKPHANTANNMEANIESATTASTTSNMDNTSPVLFKATQHASSLDNAGLNQAAVGPALPPSEYLEATDSALDLPEVDPSLSPYAQIRQQIQMLTMPPIPNFQIPPSPPPEDPSSMAVVNKKVREFLELKKNGVHFNQRLLSSSALSNPRMSEMLMGLAGIEGVTQYDHAQSEGVGIDVRHWAGLRVEQIVSEMEQARAKDAEGRKGKPRDFVRGGERHR